MKPIKMSLVILLMVIITGAGISCATVSPTTPAPTAPAAAPAASFQPVWRDGVLQPLTNGFPSAPIVLWNMFGPGHANQIMGQTLTGVATKMSPVGLAVENANIGPRLEWALLEKWDGLPRSKEGYNLGVGFLTTIAVDYWTKDRGNKGLADISPIIAVDESHSFLVVQKNAPWNSMDELIAYGKANPGKLRLATSVGTLVHMQALALGQGAGITWTVVPTSAITQSLLTLQGGGVEVVIGGRAYMQPLVESGKIKILGVFGSVDPDYPKVPSIKQGVTFASIRGLYAPKDTPRPHILWLNELFKKASETQAYQDYAKKNGYVYNVMPPDAVMPVIQNYVNTLGPIIKDLGLTYEQQAGKTKK